MSRLVFLLVLCISIGPISKMFSQKRIIRGEKESSFFHHINDRARLISSSKPDSTLLLVKVIFLDADSSNMPLTVGEAYTSHGLAKMSKGEWDVAEQSFHQAIHYFRRGGDSLAVARGYDLLGYAYLNQGYLDRHMECQLRALDYRQRFGAPHHLIGRSYGSIGFVYLELGELEKAMENFSKSLDAKRGTPELRAQNIGFSLRNIGRVYAAQGRYEDARQYYLEAIDSFRVNDNKQFLMNTHQLLGQLHFDKSKYADAKVELEQALQIADQIDNTGQKAWVYLDLAYLSEHEGNRRATLNNLKKAEEIFRATNALTGLQEVYSIMARIYDNLGDKSSALRFYKSYMNVKDSLITEESDKKLAELRTRYDLEQKEQLIDLLQEKQQWDRSLRIVLFLGLLLALLAAALVYLANLKRKKAFDALKEEKERTEALYSDLQNTQAQLIQAEKMASLGHLTAGVAHEINNPVNFITSSVSALKMDVYEVSQLIDWVLKLKEEPDNQHYREALISLAKELELPFLKKEVEELIKSIEIGAQRTQDIIGALRLYSRSSEGDYSFTDLHETIDSALLILNNKLNEQIDIHKKYGNLPPVKCLPGKLSQVFVNLLDNAIHALDGSGQIYITTTFDEANDAVLLTFRDTGKGMSDEAKKNAFDPFYTTKEVGQGTGLGLYISYGIIKQHGGRIWINNDLTEGIKISIELPVSTNQK